MRRMIGWVLLGLVANVAVVAPAAPAAPVASTAAAVKAVTELPGGKANWVVSVGGLNTAAVNNYANWTRLGWYIFGTDGTVRTSWWSWSERDEEMRVDSGVLGSCGGDVPICPIQTMNSFRTGPTGSFLGTYQTSAGKLDVTWTTNGAGDPLSKPLTEHWTLEPIAGGKVARISGQFHGPKVIDTVPNTFSDYTATFGIGYGSNAPLSAGNKASITDIRAKYGQEEFVGTYVVANLDGVHREPSGLLKTGFDQWRSCASGKCVGFRERDLPRGCVCKAYPTRHDRIRYLADLAPARNNSYVYWCECLRKTDTCYGANNHVQSLLQIIDDDRQFQGWVGVETSTHTTPDGTAPDHDFKNAYWAVLNMVTPALRGPQPS